MIRAAVDRLLRNHGPRNPLGRWCGAWYNPACDPMRKGSLADPDNSAEPRPPRAEESDAPTRDPVSVLAVTE